MRAGVACLVALLVATPAFPQTSESSSHASRGMFWTGLVLGLAGIATSVAAVTVARVEDSSTGNAPPGTYQACVAQKADPIYATNQCNALKAKNLGMLWGGVAVGAAGAVLMIRGVETSAELQPGALRFLNRIRF